MASPARSKIKQEASLFSEKAVRFQCFRVDRLSFKAI